MRPIVLALFLIGGLLSLGTVAFWAVGGAHFGWTQTYVTEQKTDPVTGISYPEKTPKFVPGLEILAAGVAAGTFLEILGVALHLSNRKKTRS